MADPIVFISSFRLREGRVGDFERMFASAVELIASTKPRTTLYVAYADIAGSIVRVVHAFPDAAAIADHFEGSEERSRSVDDLMVPAGFALYGPAPDSVVEQLRRDATDAGVAFDHVPHAIGGFLRATG
jgi:hypothetical protein